MCSVTQAGEPNEQEGQSSVPGSADDQALRDHARSVVTRYLDISRELDLLKEQAASKRKELQGLENGVKEALAQLETDALEIRGVGGVDIVQQRRKAVVRVEDYMQQLNVMDPSLASTIKQHVDSKRTFTEKEVIRVVKPKST